jgi:hypothetical protein
VKYLTFWLVWMLAALAAWGQVPQDQKAYCQYLDQQAKAEAIQLRTPISISGITQPTGGTPPQIFSGVQSSVSGIRKASATMALSRSTCAQYLNTEDATLRIAMAVPSLQKAALENRLQLLEQEQRALDKLIEDAQDRMDAQNLARPTLYALQSARAKVQADQNNTALAIAAIYIPENVTSMPIAAIIRYSKELNALVQKDTNRIVSAANWDLKTDAGVRHQLGVQPGTTTTSATGPFAEATFTYNLGSKSVNKHLDAAAQSFTEWKEVQETDIVRQAAVLQKQLSDMQDTERFSLTRLGLVNANIITNLETVKDPQTANAYSFYLMIKADEFAMRVEMEDAQFRADEIQQFIQENF